MDAQNAARSDQTKSSATSPARRGSDHESSSKSRPQQSEDRAQASSRKWGPVTTPSLQAHKTGDEAEVDDRDSDAETIVLPGKDGHSPSKIRKMKQEDKSDPDGDAVKPNKPLSSGAPVRSATEAKSADGQKRRRLSGSALRDKPLVPRHKDGSSGLSSAPASPPHNKALLHRRRRSNASPPPSSDSEATAVRAGALKASHDRFKHGDRLPSATKRKAPRTDSDDDDDQRKARRQRRTSIGNDTTRPNKDRNLDARYRSISPPARLHRRSASSQLANASVGLSQKKRRLPPPLQSTEHPSDDSDRSGSPMPRSSKLRSLATPATTESNVSPAKIIPHKKHLDAHGQTFLARACARGEYDAVKKRLGERPEDINVADYAGNTPLQIAAINGCEDIVELLIEAGCNTDCVNYDKDTPLLDAVDNGHLAVVKLLLNAGVNPRKANVSGQEPIDRITDETENADEIRAALMEARKRAGERRRTSEDRHSHQDSYDTRDSHAPDSPRHSPATTQPGNSRRAGTVRATKTRNDLLYMPLDEKTLRQAAGRGDEETVARILQVKEGFDDPESMVAAARGGHDLVIQLLLGLGGADADPGPVSSLQREFATPMLAAIGQENIKVVELLLEQGSFDPTRRFKGETYYEIARRRAGTNWKEEEHLLKNAYDEHKRSHRDTAKVGKSPGRREREKEREEKRARRDESGRDDGRPHKRSQTSPTRDGESRKKLVGSKITSPKERRRPDLAGVSDENSLKRAAPRLVKDDKPSSSHTSDRELSPATSQKTHKSKNRDPDAAIVSSDGEALKPRRKLISKGELRGERDKQRRSSMVSNASSFKEPSSPQEPRHDEPATDKTKMSEKYHDRTKALKREESKDPLGHGGDGNTKRHRSSVTPDRHSLPDKDESAVPQKRRRLDADGQEKSSKAPASPEHRSSKPGTSRDTVKPAKPSRKHGEDSAGKEAKDDSARRDSSRKDAPLSETGEKPVKVKTEDDDVRMPDADDTEALKQRDQQDKRKKDVAEQEKVEKAKKEEERSLLAAKQQEERRLADAQKEEDRKRAAADALKKQEEEEEKRRVAADRARVEKEEKRQLEEQKRRKQEEDQRQKDEAERKRQEEEQRKKEEERKKQEEERKRQEEERKQQEEIRQKQEEEELAHREQLEREAADAARRQREEEERKERERRERVHREDVERKRAAREAEIRRQREEQERARLEKMPPLVRWFEVHPNPKSAEVAKRFCRVQGCRYDTINPSANGTAEGREEWMLNTDVAILLGEKDLTLARYSAWERVPVSDLAKKTLWRTEWKQYSLMSRLYWDLGRETPGLFPKDPADMTPQEIDAIKRQAWQKFLEFPMFFIKVSEVLYTIPQVPHLRDLKFEVNYRELDEPEGSSPNLRPVGKGYYAKWKGDPDMGRYKGFFSPRWRWYINGVFVGEELPRPAVMSSKPFQEKQLPRRDGLIAVTPSEPDYLYLCRRQGIQPVAGAAHLSPTLSNGTAGPVAEVSKPAEEDVKPNGIHSNGTSHGTDEPLPTPNGIHGGPNGINGTAA